LPCIPVSFICYTWFNIGFFVLFVRVQD
jgi:hypothetical protein